MRQKVGIAIALAKNATATNLSECSHFTWRQNLIFLNRQMIHKVPQGSADVLPQGQIIGNTKSSSLLIIEFCDREKLELNVCCPTCFEREQFYNKYGIFKKTLARNETM